MDQMIEQIQSIMEKKKKLSDAEVQTVASYLMGQTPFEKVKPLLAPTSDSYYRYMYAHAQDIGSACKKDPALLPRLGRHLLLLEYAFPGLYNRMTSQLVSQGLSKRQIFLDSGLGADHMLRHLFDLGFDCTKKMQEELEQLLAADRPALAQYAKEAPLPAKLRPAAFLYANTPERERAGILTEEDLLAAFAATMKLWGDGAPNKFADALGEVSDAQYGSKGLFGGKATLQKLYRSSKVPQTLDHKDRERYQYCLIHALVLTGFSMPSFNEMARAACIVNYRRFIPLLAWVLQRTTAPEYPLAGAGARTVNIISPVFNSNLPVDKTAESIRAQLATLTGWLDALGIPRTYLCAYCAKEYMLVPRLWRDVFLEDFGGDKALLRETLEIALPMERACLLRRLAELGEPQDPAEPAKIFCGLLDTHARLYHTEELVRRVADWVCSEDETDPMKLPALDEFFKDGARNTYRMLRGGVAELDWAVWAFYGISPLPERYLRYLACHVGADYGVPDPYAGWALHIECCALFLASFHGMGNGEIVDSLAGAIGQRTLIASLVRQLSGNTRHPSQLRPIAVESVGRFPAVAEAMIAETADIDGRTFLLDALYTSHPDYSAEPLLGCLSDSSKKVRQLAVSFLMPRRELLETVRPLLGAKKKAVRECAEQLMLAYEGPGESAEGGDSGDMDLLAFCTRYLPGSAKASIRWAFPDGPPAVRRRDSEEAADEKVVLCYLALVLTSKAMELTPAIQRIREGLSPADLRAVALQAFGQWTAAGAPAKQKAALLLLGLSAFNEDILMLQKQIDDWSLHSRGAIASDAVRAMALGGSDLALMTVDTMSRKAKNKQVRRAGQEAFSAAAAALGTTPEALGDRIIPNLGFDERGEKVIDYGTRRFTALLSPSLTIELQDGSGKTIKSLPKPGAKDDAIKAEAAKADFAAMKKSLKAVVSTQSARLEQALATGRCWDKGAWEKLFVRNPIMHSFAIGLVWGVYKDGKLADTFRYMEDGTFTTVDEEACILPEGSALIGLVHPLDLEREALDAWREQLSDYEITQPILQLDRPIYLLEPQEKDAATLDRFGGRKLLGITLLGKLQKSGWYKGSVQDAGCFCTFYREIESVGVQLSFSGMYVSPQPDEVVTVGQAVFYRSGTVARGSYVYVDVKKENCIPLGEIPARLLSETVYDLTLATASSTETDANWKKELHVLF